ncbi:MAG: RNA methyltransferase [Chloroflexota bacterium]
MPIYIESRQNPRIKELLKLTKRRHRDERKLTVVEGDREVNRALKSGIVPVQAYLCKEHIQGNEAEEALQAVEALGASKACQLFHISVELYKKIAYREQSGGLLLLVPYISLKLADLSFVSPPFFVVIENVEKPGNLGAILRTADAAGVDGIIVTHSDPYPPTDVHNPNVIRSSLGTVFTVPMAQASTAQALKWLHENNIPIATTSPFSQVNYAEADYTGPIAISLGSEAEGLSDAWFKAATQQVVIPMHGIADSLNLSTSTAILLYEVVRQRSKA